MNKRTRFIVTSFLLSAGFVGMQMLPDNYRLPSIGILSFFTLVLFVWSLREGLGLNMTLLTLILPFFFTVGVGLFWFLLPSSTFARIPVVLIYGIGIYALCLTSNIYTVAAIRTIALLRAARGVGFVITLFTFFLVFDAILSLREHVAITSGLVLLSSLPLFLQGFWIIDLNKRLSYLIVQFAAVSSLMIGEIAAVLFFWPVTVVVGSLFLTVAGYMLLGLGQSRLEGRLFTHTVREYLTLGGAVLIGMFFATHWG